MDSAGDLQICYLFGDILPSDTDDEVELKIDEKESLPKSSDKTPETSPSEGERAQSSVIEKVRDNHASKKPVHEEMSKRGDFYKDYMDLTSLMTHMPTYKAVAPRIISLIVSDLQSRRLRRTTKDEVLTAALYNGLKCQHLTRRRFATYDLLLPTKEDCEALAKKVLVYEQLRIQTEYRGRRLIKVTLCKTPARVTEENVTTFFQQYGELVNLSSRVSRIGYPFLEWDAQLYLDRESFDSIPEFFTDHGFRLPVAVEGRRPLCWNCSRMGHLSADCLKKNTNRPTPTPIRSSRNVYRSRPVTRPSTNTTVANKRDSVGSLDSDITPVTQVKPSRNRPRRTRRQRSRLSSY
ncbi:unnamed protein product [Acanthosepion pharaonis]|uniref:CCHC-type domain-containing protein n=1 Tax=Acanthosepion pharaonis TaxID=158019 RepID=A0A812DMD4_ACAPH|nr:unnamed protein product [Sepia pharaonis]